MIENNPGKQAFKEEEVEKFLDAGKENDFLLELEALRILNDRQFVLEHSGQYKDQVTGAYREFDVRATQNHARKKFNYMLAVECKNLPVFQPLLSICSRAITQELYENVAVEKKTPSGSASVLPQFDVKPMPPFLWERQKYFGRSLARLDRKRGGEITAMRGGAENNIYRQWDQAISSLSGMVAEIGDHSTTHPAGTYFFYPFLLVPNKTLWSVEYEVDGTRVAPPKMTDVVYYHVDKECEFIKYPSVVSYRISKLIICTVDGFKKELGALNLMSQVREID